MKAYFLAGVIALVATVSIFPASGASIPVWGGHTSIVEQIKHKKTKQSYRRKFNSCYNKCYKASGCDGDIIGLCDDYCACTCAGKKVCPPPS